MTRDTRITAAVVGTVPLAILGASVLCCLAIANGASERWRLAFRLLCHGLESRCLVLFAVPMPICARCAGIYAGLILGFLLFVAFPVTTRFAAMALLIAAAVLAVDGVSQATGLRESTNWLRIVTGLAAGTTFGMWVLSAIEHRDDAAVASS